MFRELLNEWEIAYKAKGGRVVKLVDSRELLWDFANWLDTRNPTLHAPVQSEQACPWCHDSGVIENNRYGMSYFSNGQTNNVVVSQSSTDLFAESKQSSEWLVSIKTVTQTELFQEVAALLEEIYQAIILAGYTPNPPAAKENR